MPKKVIMHLLQSSKYSGAESVVCQIMEAFSDSLDYDMIYVSPRGKIEHTLNQRGIKYFGLSSFSQKEIDRAVKEINPDIIHAHDFNASVRVIKYRRTTISHLHNNPLWLSKFDPRTLLYALCLKHYKFVIGVSNSIKEEYLFSGLLSSKFVLLPNVVNAANVISKAFQECNNRSDLIYVGRLSHPKNPMCFLEIVKSLRNKRSNIRALMIGEGPLYDECKSYIDENRLNINVELLGFNENPYKYMVNSKVLVMPSVYEGFGLVAVEAMVLGVPVVCTSVGGLVNIVDNNCGYVSNDINTFPDEILKIISDDQMRQMKGKLSKEKAATFCNMDLYKKKLKSMYERISV